MAKVERLNKVLIPQTVDPGAIRREARPQELAGVGQAAGFAQGLAEEGLRFKEAQDASFVSNQSTLFEREIDDFFEQSKLNFQDNPDQGRQALNEFISRRGQELASTGSNEAQNAFNQIKDQLDFEYGRRYDNFARNQNISNFNTRFDNSAQDISTLAFRAGQRGEELQDSLNKIDMLSAAGSTFISQTDLADLNREAKRRATMEYAQGLIENNPQLARSRINLGEFDELVNADDLQALKNQSDREEAVIEGRQRKLEAERKRQVSNARDLQIFNVRDPNAPISITQADLNEDVNDGLMGVPEYIRKSLELEKALDTRKDKALNSIKMQRIEEGTYIFNPNDPADRKAGDEFYEESFLPSIQDLPPEEQIRENVKFILDRKFVPTQVKNELNANLASGAPENKVAASNIITDVTQADPALSRQFKNENLAFSNKVTEGINAGLTPEESVATAEAQQFLKDTPQYTARLTSFNEQKNDFSRGRVQRFFRDDPRTIPPEMVGEWQSLYRFFNVDMGVEDDQAQDLAYNKLQATWGVSKVTGDAKWVKFAPETYYSVPGVNNDWMRDQLVTAVQEFNNIDRKEARKRVEGEVEIIPDIRTVRGNQPAYQILQKVPLEDGGIAIDFISNEQGETLFWIPNFSETPEYREMQKDLEEEQSEVREKFDKQRSQNKKLVEEFGFLPNKKQILEGPGGRTVVKSIREGF